MNNPIDDQISAINEKDPFKRAELMLNVLYPYAKEFLDLWLEFMKMKNVLAFDLERFINKVMRVWNADIKGNAEKILDRIHAKLREL